MKVGESSRPPVVATCPRYKKDAFDLLKRTFPLLSVESIRLVFRQNSFSFEASHRVLRGLYEIVEDKSIGDISVKREAIIRRARFLSTTGTIVIKWKRKNSGTPASPHEMSPPLLQELERIPEFEGKFEGKQTRNLKEKNKENVTFNVPKTPVVSAVPKVAAMPAHKKQSTPKKQEQLEHQLECECCFGEFNFVDMVCCSEGAHLFCKSCVSTYVKEELYGNNRSDPKCMGSDDCSGTWTNEMMEKALSPRLRENLNRKKCKDVVLSSKIEGLWTCPNCAIPYIADSEMFITCPQCQHKSCRKCKEAPHQGLTCEQGKEEKEKANAHARMADAMTAAVIRYCPACNTSIMKTEGCNKMVCTASNCNTKFCYVCRQKIDGYQHFCQTPHCHHSSCNKCVLFPKVTTEEDDRRARRQAGLKAKATIGKAADSIGLLSPEKQSSAPQKPIPAANLNGQVPILQRAPAAPAPAVPAAAPARNQALRQAVPRRDPPGNVAAPGPVPPANGAPAAHGRRPVNRMDRNDALGRYIEGLVGFDELMALWGFR